MLFFWRGVNEKGSNGKKVLLQDMGDFKKNEDFSFSENNLNIK